MNKKLVLSIAYILGVLSFIFTSYKFNIQKKEAENLQFTNISQNIYLNQKANYAPLLRGEKRTFEFKAKLNNLGQIEMLFDNNKKINTDSLIFKLKDKAQNGFYYENLYDTSKMDSGQFYPFGFPIINNSQNHIYQIELISVGGTEDNHVSLNSSTDYFLAKYTFTKQVLINHPFLLPKFLYYKTINSISSLSSKDLFKAGLVIYLIELIYLIFFITFLHNKKKYRLIYKNYINIISANNPIIILLIIYFITHIQFFNYTQYWDAHWYWQLFLSAIENLNNFQTFIQNFNFLGHPSMGYVGLLSLSQFISFGNVYYLNVENTLLSMCAIFAFYKILNYLFRENNIENIIVTSIFAFNPLFYATSISLNLDFPVLIFETIMIYAVLYKKDFLLLVSSILLVFSKETGVLIYITFIVFRFFIYSFKRLEKKSHYVKHAFKYLIPILLFFVYLYLNKWNIWNSKAIENTGNTFSLVWDDNGIFNFGINSKNILTRIFEIFVMNFNWIYTSVIIMAIMKSQILGKTLFVKINIDKIDNLRIMFLVFTSFLIFNFIYIVMPFPRYVIESVLFFIILFYVSIIYVTNKNKIILRVILISLFTLTFIQTFKAIDPSPQLLFGRRYLGSNVSSPFFGFADATVFNTQFVFVNHLENLIKKETINYKLVRDDSNNYYFKDIKFVGTVNHADSIKALGTENLKYVYIPWFSDENESLAKLQKFFKLTKEKTLSYKGYYAVIYNLEHK